MKIDPENLQSLAWIGDGVLALFARQWLLEQGRAPNAREFVAMTSNQFLSCMGRPTEVEARIGKIYLEEGLPAAFDWLEQVLLPLHLKQEAKRRRQNKS